LNLKYKIIKFRHNIESKEEPIPVNFIPPIEAIPHTQQVIQANPTVQPAQPAPRPTENNRP
jgi:hypothetical protein